MEKSELSFDLLNEIFWNKYENIQKNFEDILSYYQLSIKYLKDVLAEIEHYSFSLNNINADFFSIFIKIYFLNKILVYNKKKFEI